MTSRANYVRAINEIYGVKPQLLDRSWGTPPMGPNAHKSRSIAKVSSLSTASVLSFDPIRVRALCVEEPPARKIFISYYLLHIPFQSSEYCVIRVLIMLLNICRFHVFMPAVLMHIAYVVDLQELHQGKRVEREMGQGTEGALRTQRQRLGWLRQRVQFTTEGPFHEF